MFRCAVRGMIVGSVLALVACGGGNDVIGPDSGSDASNPPASGNGVPPPPGVTVAAVTEVADGVLIGEAEEGSHVNPSDQWTEKSSLGGHLGSGYLVWKVGAGSHGTNGTGQGVIYYPFTIAKPGTYRLKLRMQEPSDGAAEDEDNDVFVGFHEVTTTWGSKAGNVIAAGSVKKMFHGGGKGSWDWGGNIDGGDGNRQPPDVTFPQAGTYHLIIHGRSSHLHLDRWALIHEDSASGDLNRALAPSGNG
ncbi:MAG: hypothetical protein PF961_22610 [Planctomycetota bacterium]|jgi:hypothetical protein|nr:hypothetical protein [Planctomycetota bacterium]